MTEEIIVKQCVKKNRLAQQWVFDQYADKMFYVCVRYTGNHSDAEDVMIMAFTRVFKYISNYKSRGKGSFEKWIKKIMINESIRFVQKKKKTEWLEEIHLLEDITYDFEENDIEIIMDIIQNLPDGYRTIFNLYVIEEYSHKEIADKIGISENTSKTQLYKARKKIIEELSKHRNHEIVRI